MNADEQVSYRVVNGVAWLTINRPQARNALNAVVRQGLFDGFARFNDDDSARVLVLTGAGDVAFSAGADLKEMADTGLAVPPPDFLPQLGRNVHVDKPTIAAVNGVAYAGGFLLAQTCDLVVAAENTVFKYPEAQVGFTGGLIASAAARLPHKIAMEFMLLGQDLSAQRAYEVGMVNQVVPNGTQREAAMAYARILVRSAPLVVETLKRFSLETLNKSPAEAAALARQQLLLVRDSEDGAEGRQAFAQKRPPTFKGR